VRSRLIVNLVLLAVVAGLAVFAVYRPGAEQDNPRAALTPLSAEDVARIRLQRPGQPDVLMEREPTGWRMREPAQGRVAGFRARALAGLASAEVFAQFPAPADGLAQYGLESPQATVVLNDLAVTLGDTNPVNHRRYVLRDGRVYLIADTQLTHATAKAEDLLDTRLFSDDIQPLAIRLPRVTLTRRDGSWSADPPRDDLDPDSITQLVEQWRFARARHVGIYDGPTPGQTVAVEFRPAPDAERERIEIGVLRRESDTVLVRLDEGLAYHFDSTTARRLLDSGAD
jgi:hypothetical protein